MSTATVVVRGFAVVQAEPDEVEVALEVTALHPTTEEALADVAEQSQTMKSLLDELKIPKDRRSTTGIAVMEEREWSKDNYIHLGYRARTTTRVRMEDASMLGRLIQLATSRTQARVAGPWWRVALENPARAEACRQAAAEAKRRASAYAEALGVRLGPVISVKEPVVDSYRSRSYMVEARSVTPSADPSELSVERGDLDVEAEIEVTFSLQT